MELTLQGITRIITTEPQLRPRPDKDLGISLSEGPRLAVLGTTVIDSETRRQWLSQKSIRASWEWNKEGQGDSLFNAVLDGRHHTSDWDSDFLNLSPTGELSMELVLPGGG